MPGRGPAPKHEGQRRRRNVPTRGDWTELEPLAKPVLQPLPARGDGEVWSEAALATWEFWRADPVTATWTPADVGYALDAIRLYEAMTPSTANEVRLRMDGLGLTPKGKRDLRLRVADESEDAPARKNQVRRLRVVASEGEGKLLAS